MLRKSQHSENNIILSTRYLDEVSFNTKLLLTTAGFVNIGWKNFQELKNYVNEFGVDIVITKFVSPEWGQDFIRDITINNSGQTEFKLIVRDKDSVGKYLIEELNIILPNSEYNFLGLSNNTNEYNLNKGGNFITLPDVISGILPVDEFDSNDSLKRNKKIITLVPENIINDDFCIYTPFLCLKVYLPNFDINKDYGDDVLHIDEILTIIPTGPNINDYNIWFYHPICSEDKSYNRQLKEIFNYNYDILKRFFPENRIKLFDLFFETTGKIIYPPIFNRILLRKGNNFRIIFPDQPNIELKQQIINEIEIYPNINYHFIDTSQLHKLNGNIHCGFKTIPEI